MPTQLEFRVGDEDSSVFVSLLVSCLILAPKKDETLSVVPERFLYLHVRLNNEKYDALISST